ncbi:unnamed protein product [Mytilus edulis]|uniref:Uncharacterized protein n=1 Tax=Mytilus edulis TaxID=6550 RepID=A0A8S3T5X8_MYTED|nr:unnamed protein product [Mytilus edulis]
MAVNLKDIRLKVKFTKKKPDYENTTIGPPRTVDTSDENQQEYEEVDVKATTTNEKLNHPNHNEYLDWDDRQKVKSNADTNKKSDKTETKKHEDDVKLPKVIHENTDKTVLKWKIISIISIILWIGMASALIAITTLSDKDIRCENSKCENSGTCYAKDGITRCACPNGFTGSLCSITPCSGVDCLNNATCIYNTTYPMYTCRCPAGFSGASCDVTPCSSFPWLNNGTCSIKDSTYTCSCKAETSGNQCQITPCSSSPCKNNGSCSFHGPAYNCTCKSGSTGLNCEVLKCELGGLKCDFEIEDDPNCFLQQDIFDDIDWTRNSGKTPSTKTGPCSAYQGSFYYYLEASPVAVNATARLRSKELNIGEKFDYNLKYSIVNAPAKHE